MFYDHARFSSVNLARKCFADCFCRCDCCNAHFFRWFPAHATFAIVVLQLLGDTDKALSILRARSLLVRLIQSLPTPAVAAAGGPSGLLNMTRLLAAQELAKGEAPASFETTPGGGASEADHSSVTSVAADQQAEPVDRESNSELGPARDSKLVDSPSSDQDSLLKVVNVGATSECVRSLAREC